MAGRIPRDHLVPILAGDRIRLNQSIWRILRRMCTLLLVHPIGTPMIQEDPSSGDDAWSPTSLKGIIHAQSFGADFGGILTPKARPS